MKIKWKDTVIFLTLTLQWACENKCSNSILLLFREDWDHEDTRD